MPGIGALSLLTMRDQLVDLEQARRGDRGRPSSSVIEHRADGGALEQAAPGPRRLVSSSAAIGRKRRVRRAPGRARRAQAPMRVADRARASIWRLVSVRSSVFETQ